jgi:hypothetical protein
LKSQRLKLRVEKACSLLGSGHFNPRIVEKFKVEEFMAEKTRV